VKAIKLNVINQLIQACTATSSALILYPEENGLWWASVNQDKTLKGLVSGHCPFTPEEISKVYQGLKSYPSRTILILQRSEVVMKTFRFSAKPEELPAQITNTLGHETPYDLSELIYGYTELPGSRPGHYAIRVSWTLKKNLEKKSAPIEASGIKITEVASSSDALEGLVRLAARPRPLTKGPFLLLQNQGTAWEIAHFQEGLLSTSKAIKAADLSVPEQAQLLKQDISAFKKSLPKMKLADPVECFLIEPAASSDMSALIELPAKPLPLQLPEAGPTNTERAVFLLGALECPAHGSSSLLPESAKQAAVTLGSEKIKRQAILLVILFFLLSIGAGLLHLGQLHLQRASLQKTAAQISKDSEPIIEIADLADLVHHNGLEKNIPLEFLAFASEEADTAITLLEYTYTEEEQYRLRGIATDNRAITQFLKNLKKAPYINEAELAYSRRDRQAGSTFVEFQIQAHTEKKVYNG